MLRYLSSVRYYRNKNCLSVFKSGLWLNNKQSFTRSISIAQKCSEKKKSLPSKDPSNVWDNSKIDVYIRNACSVNGCIENAIEIYEKSKHDHQIQLSDCAALTLMNSLLQANRLCEAKKIVNDFNSRESTSFETKESEAILCSIFHEIVTNLNVDELNWFVDNLIFTRKYMHRKVLQIILNGFLTKYQDLDSTVNLFERIAKQFKLTPLIRVITCELINRDDIEHLNKIVEISTQIHGKENSVCEMGFAFVICNRIEQARKIFNHISPENYGRLEGFIENLKLRQQTKNLDNLLDATKGCISLENREKIYTTLLELHAHANAMANISIVCSKMNAENIVPKKDLHKILKLLRKCGAAKNIPASWLSKISNAGDCSETNIRSYLDQNNIQEANKLLYEHFEMNAGLNRNLIRYCLMKNAEHGCVDLFQHLKPKLDRDTKIQLYFHTYECTAYTKSNKCQEYLQTLQDCLAENEGDLKYVANNVPDRIIDMIEANPDIYENYKNLAVRFADKGIIKPICIIWALNFITDQNTADNQTMWNKYLQRHPTIVCNQMTKILFGRKEIEKLRIFLRLKELDKQRIVKSELGKSYSLLFDGLFFKNEYDVIISELKDVISILPVKYLKPNTLNRIKLGPSTISKPFWNVINKSK